MLVILRRDCTVAQSEAVQDAIRSFGFTPLPVPGAQRTAICITGNDGPVDPEPLVRLPGVLECIRVTRPYKLVGREVKPENTVIDVALPGPNQGSSVTIGGGQPVLIGGPCSVENEERTFGVAAAVAKCGVQLFRAGAYKPRTSPYSFQGLGADAIPIFRRIRTELGLGVVSEVVDVRALEVLRDEVEILQVGARNMQNFELLKELGNVDRPVLFKRGPSASLDEWLMAAEYVLAAGNSQVILCERGIRTFSRHARNTLDLNIVPLVKTLSHLPVIVDPSHGVGDRKRVRSMARAGLAAGADGLIVEAHTDPASSYTDASQTIEVNELAGILRDTEVLNQLEPLHSEEPVPV